MVKSCRASTCQNKGKKGCVTPFCRVPRNKDRKRLWLTFLCRKTLPNVKYMFVCGKHLKTLFLEIRIQVKKCFVRFYDYLFSEIVVKHE